MYIECKLYLAEQNVSDTRCADVVRSQQLGRILYNKSKMTGIDELKYLWTYQSSNICRAPYVIKIHGYIKISEGSDVTKQHRKVKISVTGTLQYTYIYVCGCVCVCVGVCVCVCVCRQINPSNAELNSICHLLALLGAHHILHVSRIRVKIFEKDRI
jgi:hypothetical protein